MKKTKPLKIFDGSFDAFVNFVLNEKKQDNTVTIIGKINKAIINDLLSQNIELLMDFIVISDKKLLRAIRDSKATVGKSIDPKKLYKIVQAVENPKAILKDKRGGQLVYIYADEYEDVLLKVIVEPNANVGGSIANLAKSIGIVAKANLNDKAIYEIILGKI